MPLNKAQSEDRKGEGGEIGYILRNVMQCTGNTLTVDTYTLPVVHVSILPPSCTDGSACAQQQHLLEGQKNLICPFTYLWFLVFKMCEMTK